MDLDISNLEGYFFDKLTEILSLHERFELLLVLTEERPGALIMSPDFKDRKILRSFCEDFSLYSLDVKGQERSKLDRLLQKDSRTFKGGFFITSNKQRLENLKYSDGDFYGFSDKSVGKFLGYPEEDIKYFEEREVEGKVGSETEEIIEDMIEEGEINQEDVKYLELTSYLPKPEKSNILLAIQKGKEREKSLLELDKKFNTNIGSKNLDKLLN